MTTSIDDHKHPRSSLKTWSADEISFLKMLYLNEGKSPEVIHLFYHELFQKRSLRAIKLKISQLELHRGRPCVEWSPDEDDTLREVYPMYRNSDLTAFFTARSSNAIARRGRKLGLRKNSMVIYANPEIKALKKALGHIDKFPEFAEVVVKRHQVWKALVDAEAKPNLH